MRTPPPATDLTLDRYGTARTTLSNLPEIEEPKELIAELEFRDPNGEVQTVSSKIPLWHARYLVGIKPDSWAMSKETFRFHTAVVDLAGKPMGGVRSTSTFFREKLTPIGNDLSEDSMPTTIPQRLRRWVTSAKERQTRKDC